MLQTFHWLLIKIALSRQEANIKTFPSNFQLQLLKDDLIEEKPAKRMIFTQLKNKWKSKQQPIFKTNWKSNSKRNNIYSSTHCNALYLKIYFSFFLEVLSIFFHGLLFLWFFYVYLFINISHLMNVSSHNFEVQSSVFSGIINIIFENK